MRPWKGREFPQGRLQEKGRDNGGGRDYNPVLRQADRRFLTSRLTRSASWNRRNP